jgi:glutaredoxin
VTDAPGPCPTAPSTGASSRIVVVIGGAANDDRRDIEIPGKDFEMARVAGHVTDFDASAQSAAPPVLTVYWRPGCPFCSSLFNQLDRAQISYGTANIWEDPAAAAAVRSIANGNETVPTVTLGEAGMVNPDLHEIMAVAAELAPHLIPEGYEAPQPGRLAKWIHTKLAGGAT